MSAHLTLGLHFSQPRVAPPSCKASSTRLQTYIRHVCITTLGRQQLECKSGILTLLLAMRLQAWRAGYTPESSSSAQPAGGELLPMSTLMKTAAFDVYGNPR